MGTDDTRTPPAAAEGAPTLPAVRLTLFVAPGSHACEEARHALSDIARDLDPALVDFAICDVSAACPRSPRSTASCGRPP